MSYNHARVRALLWLARHESRESWDTWQALADDLLEDGDLEGVDRLLNAYYDKYPMHRPEAA